VNDHIGITVSDINRSKGFYAQVLAQLGYALISDRGGSASFGVIDGYGKSADPAGEFWLTVGAPMVPRVHFAFGAGTRHDVDRFFAAGLAAEGLDNGKPGLRTQYHADYYAAFLTDPDGYNIEAVCHRRLGDAG